MRSHYRTFFALIFCGLCGCQATRPENSTTASPPLPPPAEKKSTSLPVRDNALALLADLLDDEKHLKLILLIKRESPGLNRLVKKISETAGHESENLQTLMKDNAALLHDTNLPSGETAARKVISKDKEHVLLHAKGGEFQFQLLLTQVEALSYGAGLAQVMAENEPDPARAQEFSGLSAKLLNLREQVLAMLRR